MANTTSALKAVRSSQNKWQYNEAIRERVRTAVKDFEATAAKKSTAKVKTEKLAAVFKAVDKAAKRSVNVISKNKANRIKSRLSKLIA